MKEGMIRIIIITVFCILHFESIQAQANNPDGVLDVLNSTTIPAFILMGVSNTEISRPANVREFTASLQNATNGLTSLPVNYAIEFLVGKEKDIKRQTSGPVGQNLSFSFGYTQDPMVVAENSSRVGMGFKFAITKNTVTPTEAVDIDQALNYGESLFTNIERQKVDQVEKVNEFKSKTLKPEESKIIESKLLGIQQNLVQLHALQKASRGMTEVIKDGFFMDIAGGLVWDMPANTIHDTYFSKAGLWLTTGVERKDCESFIFIVRGLHEPRMMYINAANEIKYQEVNSLDFGGKIAFRAFKNQLDTGIEFVYKIRKVDELENTSKYLLNVAYKLGPDNKLSFTFGKDFDNSVTKEGNVVSLINFIKSIGKVEK